MRSDRNRHEEALDDLDLLPDDQTDGSAGFLVQTFDNGAYPTSAAAVYACHMLFVDADDTEGATPTYYTLDGTVYALNIGDAVPPAGTNLIAVAAGGRLIISYSGGSGMLLQTFEETTYPTSADEVFACHPLAATATSAEGETIAFTPGAGTIYALNVGSVIPPVGTNIIGTTIGSQVYFAYTGPP